MYVWREMLTGNRFRESMIKLIKVVVRVLWFGEVRIRLYYQTDIGGSGCTTVIEERFTDVISFGVM